MLRISQAPFAMINQTTFCCTINACPGGDEAPSTRVMQKHGRITNAGKGRACRGGDEPAGLIG